jgi:2-polyprenyl-6-hydroxyphenyl methylase/3-demethylubiquinone-9 3-methyltransferase
MLLRWLPRGTHRYDQLVRPSELQQSIERAGLTVIDRAGVSYDPFADRWRLSSDLDVNYMVTAERRLAQPIA